MADFSFLWAVAERLRRRNLFGSMRDVLEILAADPELRTLNARIIRNFGAGDPPDPA